MTAQPTARAEHLLLAVIEDAHHNADRALADSEVLDAVGWMSAHLAAAHRVLDAPSRQLRGDRAARERQRMIDLRLERLLRIAERRYSGDALAAGLSDEHLDRVLRVALSDHARAERAMVLRLTSVLPDEELDALATSYVEVLKHAPTRPHPHAPHGRVLGGAVFRLEAWRDRLLDTMDSRHVPTPRDERHPDEPGRWSRYLLGQMER